MGKSFVVEGEFCQQFTASPPRAQHIDNYGGVEEEAHQRLRVRFPRLGRVRPRIRSQAQLPEPHAWASSGWSLSCPAGSLLAGALPSRNCSTSRRRTSVRAVSTRYGTTPWTNQGINFSEQLVGQENMGTRRVCINSVLCKCAFVDIGKAREAWEFGLAVSASPHVRQGCRRGRRIVRVVLA